MSRENPSRIWSIVWLVLAAVALIVYSRSFDNGFRQDDIVYLRHVEQTPLSGSFKPSADFAFYRPGSLLLFRAEYALFGRGGGAYLAFNFMLHLLAAVLAGLVMKRLGSGHGAALIGSGLFLVGFGHYGKVVMWACCSGQIAAVVLSLAALLISLRWIAGKGKGGMLLPAAAVALMAFAVYFHETAVATPLIAALAAMETGRGKPGTRLRAAALLIPVPLLAVKCLIMARYYTAHLPEPDSWLHAPAYLLRYAGFALIPFQKTVIFDLPTSLRGMALAMPAVQAAAGTAIFLIMVYLAVRRKGTLRVLCLWFPLAIAQFTLVRLPEGWLQLRYLYFAAIPLCGLAGCGFTALYRGGAKRRAAAVALLAAATVCTAALVLILESHYASF
jgi:hypothetical protein